MVAAGAGNELLAADTEALIVELDAFGQATPMGEVIVWLHRADQLIEFAATSVSQNAEVLTDLRSLLGRRWSKMEKLPLSSERKRVLAELMYRSSGPQPGEKVVLLVSEEGVEIAAMIANICFTNGVEVEFEFRDPRWQVLLLNQETITSEDIFALAEWAMQKYEGANKTFRVVSNPDPEIIGQLDYEKWELFKRFTLPLGQRAMTGDLFYTLTVVPTPADAQLDEMPYPEYLDLYYESCDQPWGKIAIAQGKLIEKFNEADEVRIRNNDGTDVSFKITGQTFANSVVAKNVPGAEIFSSPVIDGVDGIVVASGKYQEGSSGLMEDLTLVFEEGRIIDFSARVGESALKELITADDGEGEGVRYVGELGIGTNPHLRRSFLNGLLVEKVGGSFHIALGEAYKYENYCGQPVKVNNGNCSATGIHWDITTMLRGKEGEMYLDGELVQKDGDWLDPELTVLNKGWGALPEEEQPSWWQEKFPNGYQV